MTAEELAAFAAQVRAECDSALARYDAVDPSTLPPDLRRQFEEQRQRWLDLRALTDGDVMALHEAAALHVGRELTQAEARALLNPASLGSGKPLPLIRRSDATRQSGSGGAKCLWRPAEYGELEDRREGAYSRITSQLQSGRQL